MARGAMLAHGPSAQVDRDVGDHAFPVKTPMLPTLKSRCHDGCQGQDRAKRKQPVYPQGKLIGGILLVHHLFFFRPKTLKKSNILAF